jgi:hypothetical protein
MDNHFVAFTAKDMVIDNIPNIYRQHCYEEGVSLITRADWSQQAESERECQGAFALLRWW